jgi:hypothetical protein
MVAMDDSTDGSEGGPRDLFLLGSTIPYSPRYSRKGNFVGPDRLDRLALANDVYLAVLDHNLGHRKRVSGMADPKTFHLEMW